MDEIESSFVMIVQTTDKPCARAVINALTKAGIELETSASDAVANREITILVAPEDREAAMNVAGPIMARRLKFKAFPKIEQPPHTPTSAIGGRIDPTLPYF